MMIYAYVYAKWWKRDGKISAWWIREKVFFFFFSVRDTGGLEEKTPSTPNRSSNYDLLASSPDSLPLSYRKRVGDKATKLGSFDKHPT